jgi:DNA-binding response OmpR family regulator
MHKILLVEDEKNFGMVLKDYLRMHAFEVDWCENGEAGLKQFNESRYDLCILDVMMPRMDGFSLSKAIRSQNEATPFIFLTARSMREDIVKGYLNGADDYVIKPFDSELLLLKIKAILKRHQHGVSAAAPEIFTIGQFRFHPKMRSLSKQSAPAIRLSPKESALLEMLCGHMNDILPREKALKEIWKEDNYFTGRSMDVYIAKLRKYLSPDNSVEIESLHGKGYSLRVI